MTQEQPSRHRQKGSGIAGTTVKAGATWVPPETLAELVGTVRRPLPAVGDHLTVRERGVLGLLAQGASTQAMIETLVLSPHTVGNHVRNITM